MSFVLCSSLGAVIFQTVYIINLDYTDPLLCNSTTLPCDIGYSVTEALMDSLICTSFQHSCHTQQTWVGTDVEDVEENILTGDKQWLGRVWIFFPQHFSFQGDCVGQVRVFIWALFCSGHLEAIQKTISFLCCVQSNVGTWASFLFFNAFNWLSWVFYDTHMSNLTHQLIAEY